MSDLDLTTSDLIIMGLGLLGAALLLYCLLRMRQSGRGTKLGFLGTVFGLISLAATFLPSVGSHPALDFLKATIASILLGQGVYYFLQDWKSRGVASCIDSESLSALVKAAPEHLGEANERLKIQIKNAREFGYLRWSLGAASIPILVILIKFWEAS